MRSPRRLRAALFALVLPLTAGSAAAEAAGTFALVSDIHFDPFDPPGVAATLPRDDPAAWFDRFAAAPPQSLAPYGKDTNFALLESALGALAEQAAAADFVIVPGDLLSHDFEKAAAEAPGQAGNSEAVQAFAAMTTIFVAERIAAALPDRPVILALGNNDSGCGDYEIEPAGDYLAATVDTARRLAGPDLVVGDFAETWMAGGYFAMRHPTVDGTLVIALNDVLWSAKYSDACGSDGVEAGEAMLSWLAARLDEQALVGGRIWLVHHIPWGIDPFATVHARKDSCAADVTPLLAGRFADRFYALVRRYAHIIDASFSGHIHHDSFRLILGEDGVAVAVDKVAPAISPIFGQNPGFQVWTYAPGTGVPLDYTTIYLANLEDGPAAGAGSWLAEYAFSEAYGQPRYDAAAVDAVFRAISAPGALRETFSRLYPVSRGRLDSETLPAYVCAVGHVDVDGFRTCHCGD